MTKNGGERRDDDVFATIKIGDLKVVDKPQPVRYCPKCFYETSELDPLYVLMGDYRPRCPKCMARFIDCEIPVLIKKESAA